MSEFDPNSYNAMFATILERLARQDADSAVYRAEAKEDATYIKNAVDKTNGRVTKLEKWRGEVRAKTALISASVSIIIGLVLWYIEYRSK